MNGIISLKPSSPMYNTRVRSNKIMKQGKSTFTARIISSKIDKILPTFSKVHIASISPVLASTKQLLKDPFLHHVIVPLTAPIASMLALWVILPMKLERFHNFLTETIYLPLGLGSVPYEKSLLSALEASVKYPVTFLAYLRMYMMIAPTTIGSLPFPVFCRVALKLSILYFLHELKRNVIKRIVDMKIKIIVEDELLTVDKVSSVAMFACGGAIMCEAFHPPESIVQTFLSVCRFLLIYFIGGDTHRTKNSFRGIV